MPQRAALAKRATKTVSNYALTLRYGLLLGNLALFAVVLFAVFGTSSTQASAPPVLPVKLAAQTASSLNATSSNPLDRLSAADIAVSIANMAYLPEATAVRNQAESVQAQMSIAPTENIVQSKPQIVATALKSRYDITTYTTQPGDTVSSVATKFNITSNSLMWSNNLTGTTLPSGLKLLIPPVNGIVYTVKVGDTAQSLATKFNANATQIVQFNDAELSGLKVGEKIVIPNGQKAAPQPTYAYGYGYSNGPFYASYGTNGYDFGYCTWYVANNIPVPSNWGNANTWSYYAALSGWTVSPRPIVGAIAQTPYAAGGEGHVAIVHAISPNGQEVYISDMNGLAGWDRVGYGWVPTSEFPNYIYH